MDIKVLLSAFGRPWMISPDHIHGYIAVLDRLIMRDSTLDLAAEFAKENKPDFSYRVNAKGERMSAGSKSRSSIAVIEFVGAVMKQDYCGTPGTQTLAQMLDQANADPSVSGIILYVDSPGGSVDGTSAFASAIQNSQKPVVAYVSGLMASAALWIGSGAKYRIASSGTDMIGSIGTVARWADWSKFYEQNGIAIHEVYATKSTNKNIESREAAGRNEKKVTNYAPLISNVLDPLNEEFLAAVKQSMPNADEEVYTGAIYTAKTALEKGLIDKIGSFQDAIDKVLELSQSTQSKKTTMSETKKFPKALAASKAESFDALNEGIWLTEDQLGNIESSLEENETKLNTANETIGDLQSQLTDAQQKLTASEKNLGIANAKIVALEKLPTLPAATKTKEDKAAETTADDELTEVDAQAAKLRGMAE